MIIIIGAGVAGLMAARILSKEHRVLIIESRTELGGRIRTQHIPGTDIIIEGGAEFVHGNLPVTMALLKEAGLETIAADGKMYRKQGNEWSEQEEMIEGWEELLKKMKGADDNMTIHDLL